MTGSPEDLEDRLRRVLDQAARQLQVPPAVWHGPSPAPGRRRLRRPDLGGVVVLVSVLVVGLIAVFALTDLRSRQAAPAGQPGGSPQPPAVAFEPHLTRTESDYVAAAARAVFARDRACRGFQGPELTSGSPSPVLTSTFAILRRATTPAAGLGRMLHWSAGAQLYVNQVHRARSAFGATFYVLPAGDVSGQRGVPARCGPEEAAALKRQLAHVPRRERARVIAAQTRFLAYLRYLALHPEGICAGYRTATPTGGPALMCATLANFQRWGVLVDASVYLDHAAVFWTVVPDGVATVTLGFVTGGRAVTHTVTTTVRPVNGVVVAKEPFDAPSESGFPSTITLRGAGGRLIKKIKVTPNMPTICGYGC
jgi:hypothetical protein